MLQQSIIRLLLLKMAGNIHLPNAVTPSSSVAHSTAFPQSSSWNFFDITARTVTASVGALQRYSAAGVNPYTSVVAQGLCKAFRLGPVGRRNIEQALSNLSVTGSFGRILYFGFGIEDLVRSLSQTEEGAICLGLCAALRECYQSDVAVEVLLELARSSAVPGALMPSSFEWKNLLNACSGALAATTFPLRAETFMRLSGRNERLGAFGTAEAVPNALRSCSNPKSLAAALISLSQVTKEEGRSISIIGGADAGWLVALAEWLFDCSVRVKSEDGKIAYQNRKDGELVQVTIIFKGLADEVGAPSQDLKLHEKVCVLEDASQLFREAERSVDAHVVSGRVEWSQALNTAFMGDFTTLVSHPTKLADLIGSGARILKAIAVSDDQIPHKYRVACASYCPQSYGPGLVQNTLKWFPELQKLTKRMQRASAASLDEALRAYESSIMSLREVCQCVTCQKSYTGFDPASSNEDTSDQDMDTTEDGRRGLTDTESEGISSIGDWDSDRFCLVILAETILYLSRDLAHLNVRADLYPVRAGFELAFGRQLNLRKSSNLALREIKELGQIVFCLDFDDSFSWTMDEDVAEARLFRALELFTGRHQSRQTWGVSAQCSNGICAFLNILQDISTEQGAVGQVTILPGRIDFETKSFMTLEDERQPFRDQHIDFSSVIALKTDPARDAQLKLRVKEGPNSLECLFLVDEVIQSKRKWLVGPAKAASMLASRRGWVSCKQKGRCSKVLQNGFEGKHQEVQHGNIWLSSWTASDVTEALTALAAAATLQPNCSIFLVDGQCLHCCARAALSIDRPERDRFCFIQLP